MVQYTAEHPVIVNGRRVRLDVAVGSSDADWIAAHTATGSFLGYGYWRLLPQDAAAAEHRIGLQLWINEPWQVERWDLEYQLPLVWAPKPEPARPARTATRPSRRPSRRVPRSRPLVRRLPATRHVPKKPDTVLCLV